MNEKESVLQAPIKYVQEINELFSKEYLVILQIRNRERFSKKQRKQIQIVDRRAHRKKWTSNLSVRIAIVRFTQKVSLK